MSGMDFMVEHWVKNVVCQDPSLLLRAITLTLYKVLYPTISSAHIEEVLDDIGSLTINLEGFRRLGGGCQRLRVLE